MTVQVDIPGRDELLPAIRRVVTDADEALLCVAFANEAGVNLLAPALGRRPSRVRLLATTVFGDTTAAALSRAAALGVEVRTLNLRGGTYHPKLYLARRGTHAAALVGSANLTSGLLRNIEVATLLSGSAEEAALAALRELAEGWWEHPAAEPWSAAAEPDTVDTFLPQLWQELQGAIQPGVTVRTLSDGRPNTIVELAPEALWIQTERSRRLGRGPEPVPAWMFNIAWEYLAAHGRLSNRYLLDTDGLNVKRSSAVCAVLARLPSVRLLSTRPIKLALTAHGAAERAAEPDCPYEV